MNSSCGNPVSLLTEWQVALLKSHPDIASRHGSIVACREGEQKLNLQGWTRDLSESGLRAFVADPLGGGESVIFEIPLSDVDKQVIPAKVVRSLGTDYGFEFTELSAEQRSHIQAVLRKCPALPSGLDPSEPSQAPQENDMIIS